MRIYKISQSDHFVDVLESIPDAHFDILSEYYRKGRKKGSMMSWSVIPIAPIKKIWNDYAKYGVVRDERGISNIAEQMLKNLARLQAATDLGGHSQIDPDELAKELGFKPIGGGNADFYFNFLETQYGTPVSDYGLPKLWELAEQLTSASSSEQKLLIIDQMLNVIHQRGDLAALFIEGGSGSLSSLSLGEGREKEGEKDPNKLMASGKIKIYKIAASTIILDTLEKALLFVMEKGNWKTLRKSKLMAGGILDEYGVIELSGSNVKFENDRYYIKISYYIYNDNRGKDIPLKVPVYRCFVEGFRKTLWGKEEEVGTHKDVYGPFGKLVDLAHPDRKDMVRIGEFENFVGKQIDVANKVKGIINSWGEDSDFDIDEIMPSPVGIKSDLVNV